MSVYDAWAAFVLGGFAVTAVGMFTVLCYMAHVSDRFRLLAELVQELRDRQNNHAGAINDIDDAACCTTLELHRLEARLDAIEAATRKDTFHE